MNPLIDLRSDTVTKPTAEMLAAMAGAVVGDDFFRDDPTVIALEELAAEMLGHEAAMLVLSGTMGNIVSVMAQTGKGEAYLVEQTAHIHINESGWPASIAGLTARTIQASNGLISAAQLLAAIDSGQSRLTPPTRLLCLENTHNAGGGRVMSVAHTRALADLAHDRGLKVHLDGARLFNAAAALGVPVSALARPADSVTFCLSKGLSCPAGAIVAGSADVIGEARRWRQVVGGGMRQAGIMAAAGLVALQGMVGRLLEDHENAQAFAQRLHGRGLPLDSSQVETNIVFVSLPGSDQDAARFHSEISRVGVKINPPKGGRVRAVTHRGVSLSEVLDAADRFSAVFHSIYAGAEALTREEPAQAAAAY